MRFEWDQVGGAREYVLKGQWMQPPSWTIQTRTFHVRRHNASTWSKSRVQFEALLPSGTHSWTVVAVFGSRKTADFENPTTFSFDVR